MLAKTGMREKRSENMKELTVGTEPQKGLLAPIKRTGGRNSYGRITSRHYGGGHKRRYRLIDFRRDKDDIEARVASSDALLANRLVRKATPLTVSLLVAISSR